MKTYIITVIGAALLSAFAEIISPEKWRGYVKIITGLVVISCIIAPAAGLFHSGVFKGLDESIASVGENQNMQERLIVTELQKTINADIEKRMKDEYGINISAECDLRFDDEGKLTGVKEIYIYGSLTDGAKRRLSEVYGLNIGGIHDE